MDVSYGGHYLLEDLQNLLLLQVLVFYACQLLGKSPTTQRQSLITTVSYIMNEKKISMYVGQRKKKKDRVLEIRYETNCAVILASFNIMQTTLFT